MAESADIHRFYRLSARDLDMATHVCANVPPPGAAMREQRQHRAQLLHLAERFSIPSPHSLSSEALCRHIRSLMAARDDYVDQVEELVTRHAVELPTDILINQLLPSLIHHIHPSTLGSVSNSVNAMIQQTKALKPMWDVSAQTIATLGNIFTPCFSQSSRSHCLLDQHHNLLLVRVYDEGMPLPFEARTFLSRKTFVISNHNVKWQWRISDEETEHDPWVYIIRNLFDSTTNAYIAKLIQDLDVYDDSNVVDHIERDDTLLLIKAVLQKATATGITKALRSVLTNPHVSDDQVVLDMLFTGNRHAGELLLPPRAEFVHAMFGGNLPVPKNPPANLPVPVPTFRDMYRLASAVAFEMKPPAHPRYFSKVKLLRWTAGELRAHFQQTL